MRGNSTDHYAGANRYRTQNMSLPSARTGTTIAWHWAGLADAMRGSEVSKPVSVEETCASSTRKCEL